MPRKQTQIKLFGILKDGTRAKTRQAKKVVMFINDKESIQIKQFITHTRVLTKKGHYILKPTGSENVYSHRTKNDVIIHVSLKKLVGKLTYWDEEK